MLGYSQVSAIAVLERCKANYQQKQWDAGAFLLYDAELAAETLSVGISTVIPIMNPSDPVGVCLLVAEKSRQSNLNCMNSYLSVLYESESTSAVYWRYEKVTPAVGGIAYSASVSGSDEIDACIVFSGPAKKNDTSLTTLEFQRCSHDYTETGCVIPHMVWSSTSQNKIPVAMLHTVEEINAEDRIQVANAMFADARDKALKALAKLENFTDANLEVVLFSGEGDALHQVHSEFFDCMI